MSMKCASYLLCLIGMCSPLLSESCGILAVKSPSPTVCSEMLYSPVLRPGCGYYLSLYRLRSSYYLNIAV